MCFHILRYQYNPGCTYNVVYVTCVRACVRVCCVLCVSLHQVACDLVDPRWIKRLIYLWNDSALQI